MIIRDELDRFLSNYYGTKDISDYCLNGMQIEGKENIERIVLGVSFNQEFIAKAEELKADAVIVHHGFFGKAFMSVRGIYKKRIKRMLDKDISLFALHLPMDVHPEGGHNALLAKMAECEIVYPFEEGFMIRNVKKHSLNTLLQKWAVGLKSDRDENPFNIEGADGITLINNGPEVPEKIAVISGGSGGSFERAVEAGADTFVCGDMKEQIPGISLETGTNFVNLGHYNSEKPGVIFLKNLLEEKFEVETHFVDIPNRV